MTAVKTRRQLLFELLIVLGIFPLNAALAAFISVAQYLTNSSDQTSHFQPPVDNSTLASFVFGMLLELAGFVPAFLVLYLLQRSGEGSRSIGLDRDRPRGDASLVFPVFALAFLISQILLGGIVEYAFHLKSLPVNDHISAAYIPVLLVGSLAAGVVEEIVVLGYLIRRLEQLGLAPWTVVVVAVVVRLSYHVYYGPGIVPIAFWALASVLIYRRVRRLWPFIIVHSLWDSALFIGYFVPNENAFLGVMLLIFVAVTVPMTIAWRHQSPPIFEDDPAPGT